MTSRAGRCTALALILALAGCDSVPSRPADSAIDAPPGPSRLGTVMVERPEVYVNHRPVRGTVPLNHGDKVATNAAGRAHIDLPGRGVVDLEENTDPWFIREGACVVTRILFGSTRAKGLGICVEDDQGNRVTLNSAIYVQAGGGQTVVTVLEGTVRLRARDGTELTLSQGERIAIVNTRVMPRILVPPTQLEGIRQRFIAPIVPRPPPAMPR